jgi:hypothetical protein
LISTGADAVHSWYNVGTPPDNHFDRFFPFFLQNMCAFPEFLLKKQRDTALT